MNTSQNKSNEQGPKSFTAQTTPKRKNKSLDFGDETPPFRNKYHNYSNESVELIMQAPIKGNHLSLKIFNKNKYVRSNNGSKDPLIESVGSAGPNDYIKLAE